MHSLYNPRRRFLRNAIAGLGFISLPSLLQLQGSDSKPKVQANAAITVYLENNNFPFFPKQIFLLDDKGTPLYKKSMFSKFAHSDGIDINLVTTGTHRKVIEINDPTYIRSSDVGDSGRLILNKIDNLDKIM